MGTVATSLPDDEVLSSGRRGSSRTHGDAWPTRARERRDDPRREGRGRGWHGER
jgi:hypothetical protein